MVDSFPPAQGGVRGYRETNCLKDCCFRDLRRKDSFPALQRQRKRMKGFVISCFRVWVIALSRNFPPTPPRTARLGGKTSTALQLRKRYRAPGRIPRWSHRQNNAASPARL